MRLGEVGGAAAESASGAQQQQFQHHDRRPRQQPGKEGPEPSPSPRTCAQRQLLHAKLQVGWRHKILSDCHGEVQIEHAVPPACVRGGGTVSCPAWPTALALAPIVAAATRACCTLSDCGGTHTAHLRAQRSSPLGAAQSPEGAALAGAEGTPALCGVGRGVSAVQQATPAQHPRMNLSTTACAHAPQHPRVHPRTSASLHAPLRAPPHPPLGTNACTSNLLARLSTPACSHVRRHPHMHTPAPTSRYHCSEVGV